MKSSLKIMAILVVIMMVISVVSVPSFATAGDSADGAAVTEAQGQDNASAEGAAEDKTPTQNFWSMLLTWGPLVLIVIAFYFLLIRPQKKQEKKTAEMRNSITEGDIVTTIGGITGTVRQIKDDDTYIIETGADKSKIAIKKWAIQSKDTISN